MPDSPLSDLRVLDLSRVMAGPYAGRLLADLGADVVKIEPPEGDITRLWGHVQAGLSGFYTQQNAGKRNLCIDLKRPGGAELVRRLAARADCVVENFRPGVMDRLGLSYATLAAEHPGLVMLSITGFGQSGPERDRPAYAPVIHAESGTIERHATLDGNPPSDPVLSIADAYSALHGTVALLSALHMRRRTGRGQHIDIAMLHAMVATDDYTHHLLDGALPPVRLGGQVLEAPGGPLLVSAQWPHLWATLRDAFGLRAEPGATPEAKVANRQAAVRAWARRYDDRDTLKRDLEKAGLAWGDVRSMHDVFDSPTLRQPGTVSRQPDGAGGERAIVNSPYRFSDARSSVRGPAPRRGEHNAAVLADWLDADAAQVARWRADGVLLAEDAPKGT